MTHISDPFGVYILARNQHIHCAPQIDNQDVSVAFGLGLLVGGRLRHIRSPVMAHRL
jgi:hypothetical protein